MLQEEGQQELSLQELKDKIDSEIAFKIGKLSPVLKADRLDCSAKVKLDNIKLKQKGRELKVLEALDLESLKKAKPEKQELNKQDFGGQKFSMLGYNKGKCGGEQD